MRLNCDTCSEPHEPSAQEAAWLLALGQLGESIVPRRGRGCSACNGTGYVGRQGVYELLEMDVGLTAAATRGDLTVFMEMGRERMKGQGIANHALDLVRSGRTSVAEALRVGQDFDGQG